MDLTAALNHIAGALNALPAITPPDYVVGVRADALRLLCDEVDPGNSHLADVAVALWVEAGSIPTRATAPADDVDVWEQVRA